MSIKLQESIDLDLKQDEDFDILDEFLDKRLYEDQSQQQQVQQVPPQQVPQGQAPHDDELFQSFLTDDLNKNDFLYFNQSNDNTNNNDNNYGINATTPNSIDLTSPDTSKNEIYTTPISINEIPQPHNSMFQQSKDILSNLKFGKDIPTKFNNQLPQEYLDIDSNSLPYKMNIKNLPNYSRVETQIKIELSVSPPPPQFLVHLPSDTIAKQKLCLKNDELPEDLKQNILFLDTFVLTSSNSKSCNICPRCIKREQKRASRRKSGISDNLNWGTNTSKRAIIFNCKEIISFPQPSSSSTTSKDLDISARLVCYCRHHQESKGFKLLFILKNSKDEILAKHVSTPIMIMDRKKTLDDSNDQSNNNSHISQPLSPTSIEEDSSEPHTTDSRIFKRKKTWSPELSDGLNIIPSRKPSTLFNGYNSSSSIKKESIDPISPSNNLQQISTINTTLPSIQRIIPSQGPLRGGVEITLLGSNFRQGLTVKFGNNKALSTQCWSDSTIVTYLPPAAVPGQVIVSFEENENEDGSSNFDMINTSVFTYLDDSDRQLIELALQIVGLKMNGKLEDARNIARKIIGSDEGNNNNNSTNNNININSMNLSSLNDEELVLKVINHLPNNPNWSLCTQEGQTLLHLSCLKKYTLLVSLLLKKGARVDSRDINGFTPLHMASLSGDKSSVEMLIKFKANLMARSNNGLVPKDLAQGGVKELFNDDDLVDHQRKFSNSSNNSSIFSIDEFDLNLNFSNGAHISRLINDQLTDDCLESDDDEEEESVELEEIDSESWGEVGSGEDADFEDDDDEEEEEIYPTPITTPTTIPPSTNDITTTSNELTGNNLITRQSDGSLWNKVKNVFQNSSDVEDLPKYDDLYPSTSNKTPKTNSLLPKLRFSTTRTESTRSDTSSSDENDDFLNKFFQQRKNVQNDKMLIFFWLPLLILIMSFFILINSGYEFQWNEKFQEFIRTGLGKIMLGNERVKVLFNEHFNQVNEVVTSVINVNN
ncbi:hypothetical protein BN7_4319 [Wickerhamomyces ciferrii]|uniref:IPT/TIG domain-containing protein n=1 Tax=Wickerhamomyces ciferrii (strain ATCC 14091 / BCRC 22168 / CBS 111 / JCM 3599 / NBRC 0793 / NRRL Y-1031 F-60-10) TaxID=1206466 RepID=K0KP76_WICCF|nr:uncharacterized protein BN7_4319 [Wickerhamomyces ciferrii]CCH44751.1 hypothetical protein BN7_4319 [Wickerhamomyces ciferrii]